MCPGFTEQCGLKNGFKAISCYNNLHTINIIVNEQLCLDDKSRGSMLPAGRQSLQFYNEFIKWWSSANIFQCCPLFLQGTLGQHCQGTGAQCSCERWPSQSMSMQCGVLSMSTNSETGWCSIFPATGWVLPLEQTTRPWSSLGPSCQRSFFNSSQLFVQNMFYHS